MSVIKVNFEIGHEVFMRSKKTPEGFTHDWEVFVRGQEGADISYFVEKVVFHLHETFPKPRRVVKEPPFSIKESGYAGFIFPIEIYLKNKDEPKKIKFSYDLTLRVSGVLKDRYVFQNPNEDFKKKLLKGGGILVNNNAYYTNPDQESRSRDSFSEEKPQLTSKPKLSSDTSKKHKSKEYKEEIPNKTSSCFENLFGPPIQKPPKVSPDPKKNDKGISSLKPDKKEKDRTNSEKKSKNEHKEIKTEKLKVREEKDKLKSDKLKNHIKEQERSKEKGTKRPSDRLPSPDIAKKRCPSPLKLPSPAPRSSSASSFKEDFKPTKHPTENIELKKLKTEDKPQEVKVEKDVKEKKKKEKKSHDRDKERKEKKEHKKDSHKPKESPKLTFETKEMIKEVKTRESHKEKEPLKESPLAKEKQIKPEKVLSNKFSIENLRKTPPPENIERPESQKKDKGESERKHKHKKKDKKRDESKEKHKESKEKKHKHDKIRDIPQEKLESIERRETPLPKERPIPEPASPISIDTASQCSSKSGLAKVSLTGNEDANSSHSDSENSVIVEDDDKMKLENISPEPIKQEPSPEPEPEIEPEPEPEPEPEHVVEDVVPPPKEKSKKHKDKSSKREEKRRKRKAAEEELLESRKLAKTSEPVAINNDTDRGESSGSTSVETKVQDNGVSSSLGEDAEPGELSPQYMGQLRELQKRIMTINNNEELERVVNLIAETGRYEVTTQTFDFDLCLLDRSTVQQLIQLVGC